MNRLPAMVLVFALALVDLVLPHSASAAAEGGAIEVEPLAPTAVTRDPARPRLQVIRLHVADPARQTGLLPIEVSVGAPFANDLSLYVVDAEGGIREWAPDEPGRWRLYRQGFDVVFAAASRRAGAVPYRFSDPTSPDRTPVAVTGTFVDEGDGELWASVSGSAAFSTDPDAVSLLSVHVRLQRTNGERLPRGDSLIVEPLIPVRRGLPPDQRLVIAYVRGSDGAPRPLPAAGSGYRAELSGGEATLELAARSPELLPPRFPIVIRDASQPQVGSVVVQVQFEDSLATPARVGRWGGRIAVNLGVGSGFLTIPEGALPGLTPVKADAMSLLDVPPPPAGWRATLLPLRIGNGEVELQKPAHLGLSPRMPWPWAHLLDVVAFTREFEAQRVLLLDPRANRWLPVSSGANVVQGVSGPRLSLSAEIERFGVYGVFAPARGSVDFPDVPADHWGREAVERGQHAGFVTGYPDGLFRPDAPVTRAEFVKLMVSALLLAAAPSGETSLPGTAGHWSRMHFAAAARAGLLGLDDYRSHTIEPDEPMPRFEVARLLARAWVAARPRPKTTGIGFADVGDIPPADRPAVELATGAGLLRGYPDGSFGPSRTITRAEAVTVLFRLLNGTLTHQSVTEPQAVNVTVMRQNLPALAWREVGAADDRPRAFWPMAVRVGAVTRGDVPAIVVHQGEVIEFWVWVYNQSHNDPDRGVKTVQVEEFLPEFQIQRLAGEPRLAQPVPEPVWSKKFAPITVTLGPRRGIRATVTWDLKDKDGYPVEPGRYRFTLSPASINTAGRICANSQGLKWEADPSASGDQLSWVNFEILPPAGGLRVGKVSVNQTQTVAGKKITLVALHLTAEGIDVEFTSSLPVGTQLTGYRLSVDGSPVDFRSWYGSIRSLHALFAPIPISSREVGVEIEADDGSTWRWRLPLPPA